MESNDRYYISYNLPYEKEITELIQHVIVTPNAINVKEDALHLLTSYCYPPFEIIQNNLDKVDAELMQEVTYALSMDAGI